MKLKKKGKWKLNYETDPLYRWNICQNIAKLLYKTPKEVWELESLYDELSMEVKINIKK